MGLRLHELEIDLKMLGFNFLVMGFELFVLSFKLLYLLSILGIGFKYLIDLTEQVIKGGRQILLLLLLLSKILVSSVNLLLAVLAMAFRGLKLFLELIIHFLKLFILFLDDLA